MTINDFKTFTDYDAQDVIEVLWNTSREECLDFLQWNDKNGCYTDELSIAELGRPMTEAEAKIEVMKVMWDSDKRLIHS